LTLDRARHRRDFYWIVVHAVLFGACLALQVLLFVVHARASAPWTITVLVLSSSLTHAICRYVDWEQEMDDEDRDRRK
jgi:hypothetical protein